MEIDRDGIVAVETERNQQAAKSFTGEAAQRIDLYVKGCVLKLKPG